MFDFELRVTGIAHSARPGGRVFVRFDHEAEPLAYRWLRMIRQLLLSQFSVVELMAAPTLEM